MKRTKIAVIDDRKDARELVASVIDDALTNLNKKDQWSVLQISPSADLSFYPAWINRENVGVVVVDERLNEIANRTGQAANYNGSDLVSLLRKQFKGMPIYGVTSYPDDDSLTQHFALFNEVIKRDVFTDKAKLYVERFLRTYKTFLEEHERELAELTSLSEKIALGTASSSEKKRAEAIQKSLEIPVITEQINNRKEWLDAYQKIVVQFEKTQKEINKFLQKPAKSKKK